VSEPGRGFDAVTVQVAAKAPVSDDVVSLTLTRPDGGRLPDWAPGAHIDVVLPSGMTRQY
jgi:ferredoxin-NADP reductase